MGTERVVHCWQQGPDAEDGCGTTCMLLDGHEGDHEWMRDDQITITFPPLDPGPTVGEALGDAQRFREELESDRLVRDSDAG